MAHRPAHDPPQHVAAALVRGQHAVGDDKRGGAQMIGDHPVARRLGALGRNPGEIDAGVNEGAKEIDLVIVVGALQHGGHALEPHAGVDRRFWQRHALAALLLLVLHEHEVPDLDEAVALGVGRAGRPAGDFGPVVIEDFRARPARAGLAHCPEIIGGRNLEQLALGQARDLLPQPEGVLVLAIDRHQEAILRQFEGLGDQLPGKLDRALLEIIAEGEIAEHLEEGVMAGGIADIVEVVVLAAGAHAFLRRHRPLVGPLLDAGEDVLELHHAGIGEQERRVVARHQRRGRHDFVAVLLEEVEEGRPYFVDAAHDGRCL